MHTRPTTVAFVARWALRLLLLVGAGFAGYFFAFFAWLTAGPGAPYIDLYRFRANLWFVVLLLCLFSFALSFLPLSRLWRTRRHHGERR
jgi:hypothetical protein